MSLTLYLLRHGETSYSQSGAYSGISDPELTPEGIRMAQAFAAAYQALPWAGIYVSPMKRTIATAQPLCEANKVEMQLRSGLKEMDFGKWEGQTPDWVREHYLDDCINWMTEPSWNPPTGGETAVEVLSRALSVIAEIEAKYSDGNVLIVSHKTTIRIILCNLLGIDLGRYRDRLEMRVGSVSVVKFSTYGPLLQRLGDRTHLTKELQAREEA
ncbi:histidine phosphatase family protein [Chroococcus sp. FPU101]|uniref:histidine phosphatase family protein n=1 Tax=Chroococcus sp. FPU101 TaxID=1974212 RepID=UPI001A8C9411|nr:histidine phosphatase family protein [Chroococcus sp. FPU101]GFE69364.1 Phosphoglycerate mutase [Chroococcus sp. FPU101]